MAKRFKLRIICRVIATTLQSCRSKDPSTLPQDPVPSFSTLRFSPEHQPHCSAAAGATVSQPLKFNWQREEKWHVVSESGHQQPKPRLKIYNSDADADADDHTFAPPSSSAERKNRRRRKKKKKTNVPNRLRLSTSSADSGWFSSEGGAAADQIDEEETETLVSSSISLSPEYSAYESKRRVLSRRTNRRPGSAAAAEEGEITPARLSVFKKLIPCAVEGKVKESFAVVKRSEDPYEDFKSSMMDMIVEKQMFEQRDLEQLLQCFLSLNSRHYHGIIVQAFAEIWDVVFSPAVGSEGSGHHLGRVS